MQNPIHCGACPYRGRGYVAGRGSGDILFIGEAPGQDEAFRSHRPFTGPAGQEFDRLLQGIHVDREDVYVTNLVKCNPPGNEDPHPEVIERCRYYLEREIEEVQPKVIVSLGAVALRYFNPSLSLEMVWGIPQEWSGFDLFPLYHPALGLHMPRMLPMIYQGFDRLSRWLDGKVVWTPDTVVPNYKHLYHYDIGDPGTVGVDTESTWDGEPLYCQVSRAEGVARLVEASDHQGVGWVWGMTERSDTTTVLHNSMYDLEVLHKMGIHPTNVVDTMVMAYLLGDLPQGLKALAYRLCGMEMMSYEEVIGTRGQDKIRDYMEVASCLMWPDPPQELEVRKGIPHIKNPQNIGKKILRALNSPMKAPGSLQERWNTMSGTETVTQVLGPLPGADLRDVPEAESLTYACRDSDATLRVYNTLMPRIRDEGLEGVLEMDMGIIPMVLEMQRNGINVDLGALEEVGVLLHSLMAEQERTLYSLLGYDINPGSSPQVAAMLENEGIEAKTKRGKSGARSTGVKVLEPLRKDYPVVATILEWRKFETLYSMFVHPMPGMVRGDGKVHTTIKTTRTITGRLAMESPNMQNIPTRTKEGTMLRNVFTASPGYLLVSFDYSQIEMRVAAHCAHDPVMLQVFHDGLDIHSETASRMFHLPVDQLDSMLHRYPAKRIGFGILYGISPMGLAEQMEIGGAPGWTDASCEELIHSWLQVYQGISGWMEENKAHARRYGWIADMWGRRRWTPEVWSTSKKIAEEGLRYAMNQPVQSGAQGIIKLAMGELWREVISELPTGTLRPLLQVHDDLLFECREEDVEWVIPVVRDVMEHTVTLDIAIPVEPKVGFRWGSMGKV